MFCTSKPRRWPWPFISKCFVITHIIIISTIIIATTCWDLFQLSSAAVMSAFPEQREGSRRSCVLHGLRVTRAESGRPVQFGSRRAVEVAGRKLAPSLHLKHSNYNLLKSCYPTPRSDNDGSSSRRPGRFPSERRPQHNTPVNKDEPARCKTPKKKKSQKKTVISLEANICLELTCFFLRK